TCFFFFFQAEDGIRDRNVTGVQTCALPISVVDSIPLENLGFSIVHPNRDRDDESAPGVPKPLVNVGLQLEFSCHAIELGQGRPRSEERRVGKEWRSGWWPERE